MTKRRIRDSRLKVVVADDHTLMREGVVAVLARQPDMIVTGEAADGAEAAALVEKERPRGSRSAHAVMEGVRRRAWFGRSSNRRSAISLFKQS